MEKYNLRYLVSKNIEAYWFLASFNFHPHVHLCLKMANCKFWAAGAIFGASHQPCWNSDFTLLMLDTSNVHISQEGEHWLSPPHRPSSSAPIATILMRQTHRHTTHIHQSLANHYYEIYYSLLALNGETEREKNGKNSISNKTAHMLLLWV